MDELNKDERCHCGRSLPWHLIALGLTVHHCHGPDGCGRTWTAVSTAKVTSPSLPARRAKGN